MQIMQIQNLQIIFLESAFGLVLNFQETRGLTFKMREDAIYAIWLPYSSFVSCITVLRMDLQICCV
jgi:hypothetical protein